MKLPAHLSGRYLVPACVGLAALALQLGGDELQRALEYQRAALRAGDAWRLLTGHIVHTGSYHLVANLGALSLLTLLAPAPFARAAGAARLSVVALVTSAGLLLTQPELEWYRGLSGVLHGMAVPVALALRTSNPLAGTALLAGLLVKLAWEQTVGGLPNETLLGAPVIVAAHLYGFAGGCIVAAGDWLIRHRRGYEPA